MLKILCIVLLSGFYSFSGQNADDPKHPVQWSYALEKLDDGTYSLVFKADIEEKWVLYSQHTDEGGPVATSFAFEEKACIAGEVEEKSELILEHSDLFEVDVMKFKKEALFIQKISSECKGILHASVEFMTCDGERCLAPTTISFEIEIP